MELTKIILEFIKVFIWPLVVIIIIISFREQIRTLLLKAKKAQLPGGICFDFDNEIKQLKKISKTVKEQIPENKKKIPLILLTDANKRMIELKLVPSPSGLNISFYKDLAVQNPIVALSGLRIELDQMLRNVAQGFDVIVDKHSSINKILGKLYRENAITHEQYNLILRIIQICNVAMYSQQITQKQAQEVFEIAEILRDQYLSWLSWGFE